MSYTFEGWLGHDATAATGGMKWGSFEPKKWDEDDVDIKVTHCGNGVSPSFNVAFRLIA